MTSRWPWLLLLHQALMPAALNITLRLAKAECTVVRFALYSRTVMFSAAGVRFGCQARWFACDLPCCTAHVTPKPCDTGQCLHLLQQCGMFVRLGAGS